MSEHIQVVKVADAIGYGEGGISYLDRRDEVGNEVLNNVQELINSPQILIAVDKDKDGKQIDDDGCGDGRAVGRIFEGEEEKSKSLNRPKVFGGGVTQGAAALIGLGQASAKTIEGTFKDSIDLFHDKGLNFGVHTDNHAHGENCGCGAIDKAPEVLSTIGSHEGQIESTITALGVDTTGIDEVLANFRDFTDSTKDQDYSGKKIAMEVMEKGKIVKELAGSHLEMYIVLNDVKNQTINQELIREASDNKVQAFGVDVWRMQQLAENLFDEPKQQHQAFLSELAYTLGVAATLTKGDLPVYRASPAEQLVAV